MSGSSQKAEGPRKRLDVGVATGNLSEDVRAWVANDPLFCAPESRLEGRGFNRCVDYPELPSHVYYEGYFHAFTRSPSAAVCSLCPRNGAPMDKPPCPPRLFALVEAVRRRNVSTLDRVAALSPVLKRLHDAGGFLSDAAIQVHYGSEVAGDRLGWHKDAANSVLHLAVGLHGNRFLHTQTAAAASDGDGDADGDGDFYDSVRRPQPPGAVYLSSPYAFYHAVEYPRSTWRTRVIAVQFRLAVASGGDGDGDGGAGSDDDGAAAAVAPRGAARLPPYSELREACASEDEVDLFSSIADAITGQPLALPSLDEVLTVHRELFGPP